jgi:hypothetical protein
MSLMLVGASPQYFNCNPLDGCPEYFHCDAGACRPG